MRRRYYTPNVIKVDINMVIENDHADIRIATSADHGKEIFMHVDYPKEITSERTSLLAKRLYKRLTTCIVSWTRAYKMVGREKLK